MQFPNTNINIFGMLKQSGGGIQYYKWMKLFSTGVIIYSGYRYLKRTSKRNNETFSFFYNVRKLFSRGISNVSTSGTETQKNNLALEVKELPEYVKYDGGWYVELDEVKQSSLSKEPVIFNDENTVLDPLRETTPRGDIFMYYDTETKSFNYYSNSKNIPYSTLDAVARKYVCLHKDPSIYIDIRDEVQKGREKCLKQDKDNKLKLEKSKNKSESESRSGGILSSTKKSLFAAFKNYKTGRNTPNSLHNYDGKKETVVMKDNINKFVYKGTLDQYDDDLKNHKNKKYSHSDSSDVATYVDSGSNNGCETVQKELDYIQLNHEKQDLSYVEFKNKYNH